MLIRVEEKAEAEKEQNCGIIVTFYQGKYRYNFLYPNHKVEDFTQTANVIHEDVQTSWILYKQTLVSMYF